MNWNWVILYKMLLNWNRKIVNLGKCFIFLPLRDMSLSNAMILPHLSSMPRYWKWEWEFILFKVILRRSYKMKKVLCSWPVVLFSKKLKSKTITINSLRSKLGNFDNWWIYKLVKMRILRKQFKKKY